MFKYADDNEEVQLNCVTVEWVSLQHWLNWIRSNTNITATIIQTTVLTTMHVKQYFNEFCETIEPEWINEWMNENPKQVAKHELLQYVNSSLHIYVCLHCMKLICFVNATSNTADRARRRKKCSITKNMVEALRNSWHSNETHFYWTQWSDRHAYWRWDGAISQANYIKTSRLDACAYFF